MIIIIDLDETKHSGFIEYMDSRGIEYTITSYTIENIKEMYKMLKICFRPDYSNNTKVKMFYRKTFCKEIWPLWKEVVKEHESIGESEIARIYTDFFSTTYHLFKVSDRDYYL